MSKLWKMEYLVRNCNVICRQGCMDYANDCLFVMLFLPLTVFPKVRSQGWARDVNGRDRDETETFGVTSRDETETRRLQVSRRYRDVEVHVYCH